MYTELFLDRRDWNCIFAIPVNKWNYSEITFSESYSSSYHKFMNF